MVSSLQVLTAITIIVTVITVVTVARTVGWRPMVCLNQGIKGREDWVKIPPLNRVETKTFQKLKLKELFEKDMMIDIFELREASFIAEEVC